VICAQAFTTGEDLSTQLAIGTTEGPKHSSWIMCDHLVSLRKTDLTQYVGCLPRTKILELNAALKMALDLA
jgi:mRNA interferase MazF